MLRRSILVLVVISGCVRSDSVACEDGRVCPQATVCDDTHMLCVTPAQLTECEGMPDVTACMLPTSAGACHEGVCLPAACGNGRLDPGEACDDGNTTGGDGCSADCLSDETCGNGIVDGLLGEQCDDGNHLDHDGCSSSCKPETVNWTQISDPGPLTGMVAAYDAADDQVVMFGGTTTVPTQAPPINELPGGTLSLWHSVWRGNVPVATPPARERFGMVYDHDRRRVVMFGGTDDNFDALGDTWEWDGTHWTRGPDAPFVVFDPAMAYDSKRHRVVVFGGMKNDDAPSDTATYEYDGTAWTAVPTVGSPTARNGAVMTYDPLRGVIVMFGGFVGGFVKSEVWEYDGQTWTDRTPSSNNPPSLTNTAFAYSPALHKSVLFGGLNGNSGTNTMYEWDGTQWTPFVGATPTARGNHAMTEDGRGGLLVFGGNASTAAANPLSDTWLFDGTKWVQQGTPGTRSDFAIANEFDQGKVVLYGGKIVTGTTTYLADTWELGDRGWVQNITAGPPQTVDAQMAYDELHREIVMFGGLKTSTTLDNTTWLRNSAGTWSSVHPTTSPVGRDFCGMTYDARHGVTILFGGLDMSASPLGDTWMWDGAAWTKLSPAHTPSPRAAFSMGYDRTRGVIVLFGGSISGTTYGDTWIWDGTDWHDATPSDFSPVHRDFPAPLVWSPARQSLVLAGGLIALADLFDTWEWTGSSTDPTAGHWSPVTAVAHPPGRGFAGVFSTPDGSGVAVYGGLPTFENNITFGDRWELRSDGPTASDSCVLPVDVDGDKLIGCADPDCWRVCAPDCPPGTTCPASVPQCGNGTCDALENCHTCPGDCPTCGAVCGDFVCDPGEVCPGDCP